MSLKNLKLATVTLSLFALVSCGSDSSSSSSPKRRPQKEQAPSALTSADWKIFLEGRSFPMKSQVTINGNLLLDECMGKSEYTIDRSVDPQSISMENFFVPTEGDLRVSIVDQGMDCTTTADDSEFFPETNVPFDMIKTSGKLEVIVRL